MALRAEEHEEEGFFIVGPPPPRSAETFRRRPQLAGAKIHTSVTVPDLGRKRRLLPPLKWGGPATCTQDTVRPWPEGIRTPWEVRRSSAAKEGVTSPRRAPSPTNAASASASAQAARRRAATDDERPGQEVGGGNEAVRTVVLELARVIHEVDMLRQQIADERAPDSGIVIPAEAEFKRAAAVCDFLCHGGNLPPGFSAPRINMSAHCLMSAIQRLVGTFLLTKGGTGPPRPHRAVFVVRGSTNGRVALQKLGALGAGDDKEVRRLTSPEPSAPGGWSADPRELQRVLRPLLPETLLAWATEALEQQAATCLEQTRAVLAKLRRDNQLALEAAQRKAAYDARGPWRAAMRARRGPLVKELWAALWNASTGRVQSVFFAMARVGISPMDKMFHEVAVPTPVGEVNYIVLEPAGETAEAADRELTGTEVGTRRHACASALDAYLCMRGDDEAPAGNSDLLRWLKKRCPPPTRLAWSVREFQQCPGRNMMLGKAFVQLTLATLIQEARAVLVPGEDPEDDIGLERQVSVETDKGATSCCTDDEGGGEEAAEEETPGGREAEGAEGADGAEDEDPSPRADPSTSALTAPAARGAAGGGHLSPGDSDLVTADFQQTPAPGLDTPPPFLSGAPSSSGGAPSRLVSYASGDDCRSDESLLSQSMLGPAAADGSAPPASGARPARLREEARDTESAESSLLSEPAIGTPLGAAIDEGDDEDEDEAEEQHEQPAMAAALKAVPEGGDEDEGSSEEDEEKEDRDKEMDEAVP